MVGKEYFVRGGEGVFPVCKRTKEGVGRRERLQLTIEQSAAR